MSTTAHDAGPSIAPARGLAAVLDYAAASHARAAALLVVFALLAFLPGFFQIRRSTATSSLRASHEADGRAGRICRYRLSGRSPLQEAGRHLLAAGGGGKSRRNARHSARAHRHLALSAAVARRRHSGRRADLLDRARLCDAPPRAGGGADDGKLDPARRRGAARQDRCHAVVHLDGGDGRDGAHLFGGRRAPDTPSAGKCRRSCGPRSPVACC